MSNIAISIKNVKKSFKIFKDKPLSMKEKLLNLRSNDHELFQAVNGISLDIKKGETVGLIGHNGCGKSTLLKLISKILYPEEGTIEVNGRISSLIELGAGFHPDFTGRENIYMNGSIFGLSNKEIDAKIDDIIKFSELEHFIENPVRTYSSGMYMRLAFSVAINVNPEILLIDEILSVGDLNFQKKCFEKIEGFKSSGATIVIVAHDLGTLEKICDRVVWVNKGKIVEQGNSDYVINLYNQHMNEQFVERRLKEFEKETEVESQHIKEELEKVATIEEKIENSNKIFPEDVRWGSKEVEITNAKIVNNSGIETDTVLAGEKVCIEIDYKINKKQEEYIFGMGIYTIDKYQVYGTNTEIAKLNLTDINEIGKIKFEIPQLNLLSGKYKLNVAVVDKHHRALDFIKYYMDFAVVSNDQSIGVHSIEHHWKIN
ncbi:ABC transporter ATP-binding protein [Solibacillus sp. FSL W8-0474]|uniref:ABC transporter ATP-binding protein n=1 Tax=Solibacillus sp. FSL W8-0474 TaxID=2975336 RepID=UPI0030FA6AF6